MLSGILPPTEKSDMTLVGKLPMIVRDPLLRRKLLDEFPFWYHPGMIQTSQCYWSENHYIMNVSSEYLLRLYAGEKITPSLMTRLITFLELKCTLGCAEFLSPVYYPFTIASLINLYDLTDDPFIRKLSQRLLDRMANEIMSVVMDGSIISPSGRSYIRHREKTRGYHLNVFIDFLMGKPILPQEQALTLVLANTTYRPTLHPVQDGEKTVPLSPPTHDLYEYLRTVEENDIVTSLLWNYGAYLPLDVELATRCITFMDKEGLWDHPHFRALSSYRKKLTWMSTRTIARILIGIAGCRPVNPYVDGALLTGATMKVFRQGSVVMSSLTSFHEGCPCYQQTPWAVNVGGIPVWSSFGSIGNGGLSKLGNKEAGQELSTSRLFPIIKQEGNRLEATYRSKTWIQQYMNRHMRPAMFWKEDQMDATGTHHQWIWGQKGTAVIAYRIEGCNVTVYVNDTSILSREEILATLSST